MKTFDIKRFCHVAQWDLTVNSRFYLRQLLILACCVVVPVLLQFINIFVKGKDITVVGDLSSLSYLLIGISIVWQFVMLGYTFHNLRSKQGRIEELMLPATNLERFTWHVLFCIVVPIVAFWLSVLVADGLQMLLTRVLLGTGYQASLTGILWKKYFFGEMSRIWGSLGTAQDKWAFIWGMLMLLAFYTTFLLGNAWKYKSNIGLTIAAHIALFMVATTVTGFLSSIEILKNWIENMEFSEWIGIGLLVTIAAALFALIWGLAYHLYCKAQISTRRNP